MSKPSRINVTIVYPADPLGTIPGGIDTCIRGLIRWAPEDITYSILGVTTDRALRKPRQWTECSLGRRSFMFYPVLAIDNPERQPFIPATIQLMASLALKSPRHDFDILQFHRIEPALGFLRTPVPKITFIHQNMEVLRNSNSDIRWKHAPWMYFKFEDFMIPKFDAVFVVHEQAVANYRERYPQVADRIRFLPTWMDPEIFFPANEEEKQILRANLFPQHDIPANRTVMIAVGRIDRQKNPALLAQSFSLVAARDPGAHLVMVGDGVLRKEFETMIEGYGLKGRVTMLGIMPNTIVGDWLRASDMLVLSSAYEGMPRCVVEAMGCGIPVATTDVGEVKRLVEHGVNGCIATAHQPDALAQAVLECLANLNMFRGEPCLRVASRYTPETLLGAVYDRYRSFAKVR